MVTFALVIALWASDYVLPWWAWGIGIAFAFFDVIDSDMARGFWRGLTGN